MRNFGKYNRNRKEKTTANSEVLPVRLNILFGIAGFLLLVLVLKLAQLTIIDGDNYYQLVNRVETTTAKGAVPRGTIYDSTGKIIVGPTPTASVTYQRGNNVSTADILKTANRLAKLLSVDTSNITERQQIDYYLANPTNSKKTLSKMKVTSQKIATTEASKLYNSEVKYLTKKNFQLSDGKKNNALIYYRMASTPNLNTGVIKETDVSNDEIAKIGERLSNMEGIGITQNWLRSKAEDDSLQQLAGNLSSSTTGLPDSQLNKMLAFGYDRNSRVGTSGLEEQYELSLHGIDKLVESSTTGNKTTSSTVKKGQDGQDLNLTINSEFQKQVQSILRDHMAAGISTGAYATVINPYTGGIYAMAGWNRDPENGEITANATGNINTAMLMGSAVKPAMVANALQQGVITPNENTLLDQEINIAGSKSITSLFNKIGQQIPLTAQQAIEESSNTYMVQLALKINKSPYYNGMSIPVQNDIWPTMRNGFEQFGLGTKTGIDLPGETSGSKLNVTSSNLAQFINLAYGQIDAYTPIQMSRYVSAIANGGYLVTPHLVKNITDDSTATNKQSSSFQNTNSPKIDLSDEEWKVITDGMYMVAHGPDAEATGRSYFANLKPAVAAKTGTAEAYEKGQETTNDTLILYTPGQPFALVVAYPNVAVGDFGRQNEAAVDIYNAFWSTVMDRPS